MSDALAAAVQRLEDERDIGLVKARYFRYLDTKQWDLIADLFTDDAPARWDSVRDEVDDGPTVVGGAAIAHQISTTVNTAITVHQGHMAEITFTGPDEAQVIHAMHDHLEFERPGGRPAIMNGDGHYHERYVRTADGWRIAAMRLTRLRFDVVEPQPDAQPQSDATPDTGAGA